MRGQYIFLYEWKHLWHSPFKLVALLLFIAAAVYGLHNGANLFHIQMEEIASIQQKALEERQTIIGYYEQGKKGPEDRPWVNLAEPFWAIWSTHVYHFKEPSPAMVYSIGQAEQYGYYKRVLPRSTPYDADMAQEIANPERLQSNNLDYAFVMLFLQPILLLILLYNLKSSEVEQGLLPLIEVQVSSGRIWLMVRMAFYLTLVLILNLGLLVYGAMLTGVFSSAGTIFGQVFLYSTAYLLFWSVLYFVILSRGKTIMGNALQMAGIWLLLAFVIPAAVHQTVSMLKPANLMTDVIDATRDDRDALFELPDSTQLDQLNELFPEISNSPATQDSSKRKAALDNSIFALINELNKRSTVAVEHDNQLKNQLIQASYGFNPVTFFQNRLNSISKTHYDDYEKFRSEIQALVDQQIKLMVLDTWEGEEVDEQTYQAYHKTLTIN